MFSSTSIKQGSSSSSSTAATPSFKFDFGPTPSSTAANGSSSAATPAPPPRPALASGRRQQVNKLGTFDLTAIRTSFEKEHPAYVGISQRIEAEYRKFLEIKQQHVDTDGHLFAAPPIIIHFWRIHVLHMASYAAMWQAAGVQLHYEPDLNDVNHESYARRIGNTVALYRAMFGKDPRDVHHEIWAIADDVLGEEGSKKNPEGAATAAAVFAAVASAKAELPSAPQVTATWVKPSSTAAGAVQPAPESHEPMPEYDPDTLYDSDGEDAADQDMSQVWSLTVKAITGKVYQFRFKKDIQVGQLKHVIEMHDGLPPCMQRLIFSGKQLENTAWLKKDECVADGSVMHLVVKLRGC